MVLAGLGLAWGWWPGAGLGLVACVICTADNARQIHCGSAGHGTPLRLWGTVQKTVQACAPTLYCGGSIKERQAAVLHVYAVCLEVNTRSQQHMSNAAGDAATGAVERTLPGRCNSLFVDYQ